MSVPVRLSNLKKKLIVLCAIVAVCGICFGLGRWYFFLTDGFGPSAITSDFSYDAKWDIAPLSADAQVEINRILDQKYSYMDKGCECYVLESKDGCYVMKFFKQKHLYLPWWQKAGVYLPVVGRYAQEALERREDRRQTLYSSCLFGYQECAEETGIVYVHLNPSEGLPNNVMIFDKLGYRHFVDLNQVPFYLQRRGVPLNVMLQTFKHSNDIAGAANALEELFTYLERRSAMGVEDTDPNVLKNLGFLDGRAVNLDPGGLQRFEEGLGPNEYRERVMQKAKVIRNWIAGYFPELLPQYDAIANRFATGTL